MAKEIVYRNLEAEFLRAGIDKAALTKELGISMQSLNNKLKQKTEFTLAEMDGIKSYLQDKTLQEFTLDYLFERGE